MGGPDTDSCRALERAASIGDVEAVRMLLDAGAKISHGVPLHYAAGARLHDEGKYARGATQSQELDEGRIPVMALLVERGADVNMRWESRHLVVRYPISYAVNVGAFKRVRWLLERGANPELRGQWGSAVDYVQKAGSEEMKRVVLEGWNARRWVK